MRRLDDTIDIDAFLSRFEACGGTDEPYLRAHFARFVKTQQRFLAERKRTSAAILDVGAHWLHQSLLYALRGFEVTALDTAETFQDPHVKKLAEQYGITLLPEPDLAVPQALGGVPSDSFDVVLFTEIIEHLTFNPVAMWKQIYRVMKPGARLVVTTPNYYALRGRAWRWSRFLSGAGAGLRVETLLSQPTFAHHWKEYSLTELRRYFSALSPDFRFVRAEHVEKYGPSQRSHLVDGCARLIERCAPVLRPELYLELELSTKNAGIVVEPRW
ncbi:MAG: methyltransferase domain-containing protein [Rudaea sp.]